MAKKTGLGANFASIFDEDTSLFGEEPGGVQRTMKITDIEPNKSQPRRNFEPEALNALASSIAEHGVIIPLTVRPYNDTYQIVAGERRWRAAKIAGLSEVPVRVMELTDEQTMQIALIENLQREDLNPIEEALGYQQLIETFGMRQEDVARKIGKARSSITNSLRLLTLPQELIDMVADGQLSQGHSKVLMSVTDAETQISLAKRTVAEGLSVRALEKLAKQALSPKKPAAKPQKETFLVEAEISMTEVVGKPVRIEKSKDRYTLSVDCKSEEELKELMHFISKK